MNKSSIRSIVAVSIPLACALIVSLMCYSQYRQRDLARQDQDNHQRDVDALQHQLDTISIEPLTNKRFAFEQTNDEQAQFLTQLRMDAQSSGVKLAQYTNMGVVFQGQQNQDKNAPQSMYRPLASTLTVQGPYDGVRAFAYSLLRSNRLMNMTGVTWKRDPDGRTQTLSFTLIRYVTNPTTTVSTTRVGSA